MSVMPRQVWPSQCPRGLGWIVAVTDLCWVGVFDREVCGAASLAELRKWGAQIGSFQTPRRGATLAAISRSWPIVTPP